MKHVWLAGAVVVLGLCLRIVHLDARPLGFTWDEAALGYNAYSLLKTGRDEHGQILPVVFKSFGDFKPGAYVYFTVPSVAVLGLNEFATRLPSALFGTLAVILMYLFARSFFGTSVAWFSAAILAINPWAIHFSRGAWEANVALVMTLAGVLLFLKNKYLSAALIFGLTFWTYQGAKMFTPLIMISLLVIYRPAIKRLIKPLLLLLLLFFPIGLGIFSQSGRLQVFSVFSYTRGSQDVEEIQRQDSGTNFLFTLFHSQALDHLRGIAQRYLNHYSPYYLFIAGDWTNNRHTTPYYGYFHLPEAVVLALGVWVLVHSPGQHKKLLIAWLLLAAIPSALSRDIVSGVRSLPLVVPTVIVMGLGAGQLWKKRWPILIYIVVLAYFGLKYLDLYYIHSPHFTARDWLSPYQQAMEIVGQHIEDVDRIVFTDKLGQPYIFALFYLQIDPRQYQLQNQFVAGTLDVGHVSGFGKFEFRPLYWPEDQKLASTLFVGGEYELPENTQVIPYPNGATALKVIANP